MDQEIPAQVEQETAEGTAPVADATPSEKMLPQSKVNDIVRHEKHAAYEKGKREALAGTQSHTQPSNNMGGMQHMSEQQIRLFAAEEAQKQQQKLIDDQTRAFRMQEGQRTANEFMSKMSAAKERLPELDGLMKDVNLADIAHIVQLANGTDNTADVMHDLLDNPSKIAAITTLMQTSPALAQREIARLSSSIKANEKAKDAKDATDPLNQMSHSTVGTDNGSMTLKDLKRVNWLRA